MKFTLLALLSLLALPVFSQENTTPEPRIITVTGHAERDLPADRVRISAALRVVRNELAEARSASQEGLSAIVEALGQVGVAAPKIHLENHLLGREFEPGPDGRRLARGFYSERQFTVELDDPALLELVHGTLAEHQDISVRQTAFSRKDEIDVRKELRQIALEAARDKAEAMAAVYEQGIGLPLKISEGGGSGPVPFNARNNFAAMASDNIGGTVTLEAMVEVTFEMTE